MRLPIGHDHRSDSRGDDASGPIRDNPHGFRAVRAHEHISHHECDSPRVPHSDARACNCLGFRHWFTVDVRRRGLRGRDVSGRHEDSPYGPVLYGGVPTIRAVYVRVLLMFGAC